MVLFKGKQSSSFDVGDQYLLAKGTTDDNLFGPLLQLKLNVLNKAGLCKDSFVHLYLCELELFFQIETIRHGKFLE